MELYIADHAARVGGAARQEEHDRLLEQITKHDFMAPTIKIRFKKQLSGAQRKQREEEAEADRARAEKEKRDALVADATVSLADVVGQDDAYFEACFGGALLHAVPHDDAGGCLRGARHHFGP